MSSLRLWQLLVLWAVWLALYGSIAQGSGSIHHDMAEIFAWGEEWPLGTYKHPPLAAWASALWFSVMPRTDAAFYLLAGLNAALGLWGAWRFARALIGEAHRDLALPLLMLTPSFGLLALTFNANSVLLALWPWTAFAFLRSLERKDIRSGLLFGLLAGLALLGKYYSALLLMACLAAALLHPERNQYFRSRAPYVAILTALLVVTPHAVWSWVNNFPAITYAMHKAEQPLSLAWAQATGTLFGGIALAAVPVLALALARRQAIVPRTRPDTWVLMLCLGPWVATLVLGFVTRLSVSTNFLIPALFVVPPLLLLAVPQRQPGEAAGLNRLALIAMLALLGLAPLLAYGQFRAQADAAIEPRRELAELATALWRREVGEPLRLTAGSAAYGLALPFYSPDRPSDFTDLDFGKAPWVSETRIANDGLLVACLLEDRACANAVGARPPERASKHRVSLSRRYWGMEGPAFQFELTLFRPATAFAARH